MSIEFDEVVVPCISDDALELSAGGMTQELTAAREFTLQAMGPYCNR